MKNKILVYPFTKELCPLIRYRELLSVDIHSVIGLKSCGIIGKDASVADGGEFTGIIVNGDFEASVNECDEVWFFEDELTKAIIKEKARTALDLGKTIKIMVNEHPLINKMTESKKLKDINAPIIMVSGIGENTRKFEVQLAIRKFFSGQGYRVSQMGSSSLSSLFGFESTPLMTDFTLEEKVFSLNNYLYEKTKRESADLLIVGVPGGVRGLDIYNLNHFAEMAFAISFAVKTDISICCMYHGIPEKELFEYLNNYYLWKFGVINDYYHITNVVPLPGEEVNEMKIKYMASSKDETITALQKSYQNEKVHLFSVFDEDSLKQTLDNILAELTGNSEAVR